MLLPILEQSPLMPQQMLLLNPQQMLLLNPLMPQQMLELKKVEKEELDLASNGEKSVRVSSKENLEDK
jgi:hypothetical protein